MSTINRIPTQRGGSQPGTRTALRRTSVANPDSMVFQVRQAHRLTQQQMADALGVSRKQVNVWEKTNAIPANYEPRKKLEKLSRMALTK